MQVMSLINDSSPKHLVPNVSIEYNNIHIAVILLC